MTLSLTLDGKMIKYTQISDPNDYRFVPEYRNFDAMLQLFKATKERVLEFWTSPRLFDPNADGYQCWFGANGETIPPSQPHAIITYLRIWYLHALKLKENPTCQRLKTQYEYGFELIEKFKTSDGKYYSFLGRDWEFLPTREGVDPFQRHFSRTESLNNIYLIYMSAEVFACTQDKRALTLAESAFDVLDNCGWDNTYGGYWDMLDRENPADFYKVLGQQMHAALALTKLYKVSPKPIYRQRAEQLYQLICEKTVSPANPHAILSGHNAEVIWYLEDVANCFDRPYSPELIRLRDGVFRLITPQGYFPRWCGKNGEVEENPNIISWWSQLEVMISLLRQYQMFKEESFLKQFWQVTTFTFATLVNPSNGVFYAGRRIEPDTPFPQGGGGWKTGVHTTRAMLECIKVLENIKD